MEKESFSFGECKNCGADIGDSVTIDYSWYGNSGLSTGKFCSDKCRREYYLPYVRYSIVINISDPKHTQIYYAIQNQCDKVYLGGHRMLEVSSDQLLTLMDFYSYDAIPVRNTDGYLTTIEIRISFPQDEWDQLIEVLR